MNEEQAVNKLAKAIRAAFKDNSLLDVREKMKIPYAFEIVTMQNQLPDDIILQEYETDLAIIKKEGKSWKPRVIIEAKLAPLKKPANTPTTHDLLTYNEKAVQHKAIFPQLRYGFVVIHRGKKKSLPARVYRHGKNFDFLCSVSLNDTADFMDLLNRETAESWNREKIIYKRKPRGTSCRVLIRRRRSKKDDA